MKEYIVIINVKGNKTLDLFMDKLRKIIKRITKNNSQPDKWLSVNTIMSGKEYDRKMDDLA